MRTMSACGARGALRRGLRCRLAVGLVALVSAVSCTTPARPAPALAGAPASAQSPSPSLPTLHHVGLNSVDPERAIAWYLALWPSARRTEVAGVPSVQAEMLLMFHRIARQAPGAWRHDLHRPEEQSPFWHIGAFVNTTTLLERLAGTEVAPLPLWISPTDTVGTWRSGLAPYAGTLTAAQLATAAAAPPRDGGFAYVVAPDGVLFELTGGPGTREALAHVHFLHEQPLCAANWYVAHLGFALPPVRDSSGVEHARAPHEPCAVPNGEAGWPSLERVGTIRQPAATVRYGNGSMGWYPRQCTGTRCGGERRLVRSRGQVLDHVAFGIRDFDARYATLVRDGVTILERPHRLGTTRAFMLEDPDGLAIELVEIP
ncbi:MAG: VOC family protein [Gemmatimonadaceae bacterium]|nr:VOC family protein [Gemmatimonadaceae bacterium]